MAANWLIQPWRFREWRGETFDKAVYGLWLMNELFRSREKRAKSGGRSTWETCPLGGYQRESAVND